MKKSSTIICINNSGFIITIIIMAKDVSVFVFDIMKKKTEKKIIMIFWSANQTKYKQQQY